MGPPGSGKGTLAADLRETYNIKHISTGDLFRENISQGTELGKLASSYMEKGELVPDQVTIDMVRNSLASLSENQGFLLDGFPRTVEQADALTEILQSLNRKLDAVLQTVLDDETIVKRLAGRRVCTNCGASYNVNTVPPKVENICDRCNGRLEQRNDDAAETVQNRLDTYYEKTRPLIDYYAKTDLLFPIETKGKPKEAFEKVCKKLDRLV